MLPPIVERQIHFAESVAAGLRLAASNCPKGLEALRTRLAQGADTIGVLVALVRVATFTAKLNHDTIQEMQHERADIFQTACIGEGPDYSGVSTGERSLDAGARLERVRSACEGSPHVQGDSP